MLFCSLLVYQLKDSAKREQKYQQTIGALVEKFEVLCEIKEDNEQIKKDNAEIKRMLINRNGKKNFDNGEN